MRLSGELHMIPAFALGGSRWNRDVAILQLRKYATRSASLDNKEQ
jgi:hypothetical protein